MTFSDDTKLEVETVIWATGSDSTIRGSTFRSSTRPGNVIHERGVTGSPGLFFIGLPWQYTRGSALIGFVKEDAEYLAGQIAPPAASRLPPRMQ